MVPGAVHRALQARDAHHLVPLVEAVLVDPAEPAHLVLHHHRRLGHAAGHGEVQLRAHLHQVCHAHGAVASALQHHQHHRVGAAGAGRLVCGASVATLRSDRVLLCLGV
eukprot:7487324-Pyramimonas_sp.AAC.1